MPLLVSLDVTDCVGLCSVKYIYMCMSWLKSVSVIHEYQTHLQLFVMRNTVNFCHDQCLHVGFLLLSNLGRMGDNVHYSIEQYNFCDFDIISRSQEHKEGETVVPFSRLLADKFKLLLILARYWQNAAGAN